MQMNLFENIKIFIEIVDAGSFAQAAENLQIHRPAVTKALQQLEQESGVRLLQHHPASVSYAGGGRVLSSQQTVALPGRRSAGVVRAGPADPRSTAR